MRSFAPTVAASNARRVLDYGRGRGFASRRVRAVGTRVPLAHMHRLWAELVRELNAPGLPMELAARSCLEDLDLLGFAILSAPNVFSALETFVEFSPLLNDGGRWQLELRGKLVELRWIGAAPSELGVRVSNETAVAQLVKGVRQLCGGEVDPVQVGFRHAAPSRLASHRAFLRCPLHFDDHAVRVTFSRELAEIVPAGANERLWTFLCAQAVEQRAQLPPAGFSDRVRHEIACALAAGESVSMERCAEALGVSSRTLRRELGESGSSFRALVDEARRTRVRMLLRRALPLTQVALEAGFSDASALTHACRRWFGQPPSALAP